MTCKFGQIVEESIVQPARYFAEPWLKNSEIGQNFDFIELVALDVDFDCPIVAVQGFEISIGKPQLMSGGKFGFEK